MRHRMRATRREVWKYKSKISWQVVLPEEPADPTISRRYRGTAADA